ncbi:hypothetical protein IC229_33125 [Spirosoma sp. BT702]|uniref:Uncharacterized protein n=1 Tax=Spirosoma profusum TaxID=2771354 RepID=A0A927GAE6_9BACT|nr:hypothetical protein [Spirosoma profusum]MBD2705501.1 hypothetical protein [Spirosoma profusum]
MVLRQAALEVQRPFVGAVQARLGEVIEAFGGRKRQLFTVGKRPDVEHVDALRFALLGSQGAGIEVDREAKYGGGRVGQVGTELAQVRLPGWLQRVLRPLLASKTGIGLARWIGNLGIEIAGTGHRLFIIFGAGNVSARISGLLGYGANYCHGAYSL